MDAGAAIEDRCFQSVAARANVATVEDLLISIVNVRSEKRM